MALISRELILQKKRKDILEKKIEVYKNLVKKLMEDKDIQKDIEDLKNQDGDIKFDEFKAIQKHRDSSEVNQDVRSLL